MKLAVIVGTLLLVGLMLPLQPVVAHHGNSEFDSTKEITLKGTITTFEFLNPHAEIVLEVKNDQGTVEKWHLELGSPNSMRRNGWNRNTVKAGMDVTVKGYPNKHGSKNLFLQKLVLPDGKEIAA